MNRLDRLQAAADRLQHQIESDHRASGHDPAMADLDHPLNARWQEINDAIQDLLNDR